MGEVTVQPGGSRDGWVWLSVNGVEQWVKTSEPTDLDDVEIEVLAHAGLSYSMVASGNFINVATSNAADGVYTLNGQIASITDIVDLSNTDSFFDPETDIDADGLKPRESAFGTDGLLLAMQPSIVAELVPGGFTVVYDFYCSASVDIGIVTFVWDGGSDFNSNNSLSFNENFIPQGSILLEAVDDSNSFSTASEGNSIPILDGQVNRVAFTITPTGAAASLNGGEVWTMDGPAMAATCDNIELSIGGDLDARMRSFAFYSAVSNDNLPALSAL